MHLTDDQGRPRRNVLMKPRRPAGWMMLAVIASLALIFILDHETGSAPVQHLYYLPIIVASIRFGDAGSALTALAAILLYHLARPHLFTLQYVELDVVQIALFAAVGATSAKLAADARRLRQLATTDDLTGLHNLRSFEARLRAFIDTAADQDALALVVLDLDHLKALNDVHGHLTGADAVRSVGHIIAELVPAEAVACRYGGDEFVIALPGCSGARALAIADQLRLAVHACAPVLAGVSFPPGTLSISAGAAARQLTGRRRSAADDVGDQLFRAADAALYAAKEAGRNRVSLAGHGVIPPT